MSLADARCSALQCASLVSAGPVSASSVVSAGAVTAGSINADVAASRIQFLTSAALTPATLVSAVIPGLTGGAVLFVQQVSSGAAITAVVADTFEPVVGDGFVIRLTANPGPFPVNCDYNVYIARY